MASRWATLQSLRSAATSRSPTLLFQTAAECGKDRKEVAEVLDLWRAWLRDVLMIAARIRGAMIVNETSSEELTKDAERLSVPGALAQLRIVDEVQMALRGNVNPTLAVEHLLLHMREAAHV